MKSILEFNMPEDKNDFKLAMNGADYFCALWDIKQLLRDYYKHNMDRDVFMSRLEEIVESTYLDDIE